MLSLDKVRNVDDLEKVVRLLSYLDGCQMNIMGEDGPPGVREAFATEPGYGPHMHPAAQFVSELIDGVKEFCQNRINEVKSSQPRVVALASAKRRK